MLDAHLHIKDEKFLHFLIDQQIEALINIASLEEFQKLKPYLDLPNLHYSVGIHPWNVMNDDLDNMTALLKQAPIIGEIGLDSVWCDCNLNQQKIQFEKQLKLAYESKKKVILHTKGEEATILPYLKKYPNTYLIHWYSCMDHLKEYIDLDCYFTIGPDLNDPAIIQIIQQVDLHRLLIESDGISAIAWVKNKPAISIDEYLPTLQESVKKIAEIKNVPYQDVLAILHQNFKNFIHF